MEWSISWSQLVIYVWCKCLFSVEYFALVPRARHSELKSLPRRYLERSGNEYRVTFFTLENVTLESSFCDRANRRILQNLVHKRTRVTRHSCLAPLESSRWKNCATQKTSERWTVEAKSMGFNVKFQHAVDVDGANSTNHTGTNLAGNRKRSWKNF